MKKRILSFILVLVMMLTMIPVLETEAKAAELKYTDLLLEIDWDLIKKVGSQTPGSNSCASFSLAYLRTILDGKVHYYSEYSTGTDEYDAYCPWTPYACYKNGIKQGKNEAFRWFYDELSKGKPVIAQVTGRGSVSHYVTVVGFENITSLDSMTENNFLIIDPVFPKSNVENMGKVGYQLYPTNNYGVCVDGTGKTVKFKATEACKHSYDKFGVCKNTCKQEYNYMASKDTKVAGIYEMVIDYYPRTDKPYSASENKTANVFPKGKEVTVEYSVVNHSNNLWYYVSYNGMKGYVFEDYVKFKRKIDQETPTPEVTTYTTTLNANGGVCGTKEITSTKDSAIGTLPTPTLNGYIFDGWYSAPYGGNRISSTDKVIGNGTIHAHWKHDGNKLSFNFNGGTYEGAAVTAQLTSVNNGRPGGALVVFNESGTTVNTNIYGCEIAVDSNGKIVGVRDYGDENKLTVPQGGFVLSGQHGWDDKTSQAYGGYVDVKNILELGTENTYVYLDYQDGMVYAYDNQLSYIASHKYVENGSIYENLPVPVKDGYFFRGWQIDGTDQYAAYNKVYIGSKLTAVWNTLDTMKPKAVDTYNGRIYELYEYPVSWYEAQTICEAKGGHLVTITSHEEQLVVANMAYNAPSNFYFIGCTDENEEGTWTWVTGEPFDYTCWGGTEPNGGIWENYGQMVAKENAYGIDVCGWNDNPPTFFGSLNDTFWDMSSSGFICEYEAHTHSYQQTVIPPNCYEKGYTLYECQCGYSYKDNYMEPYGHHPEVLYAKDATCTENGYTGDEVCRNCGVSFSEGEMIQSTGHKWDDGKIIKQPTETTVGIELFTCTVCSETMETQIAVSVHKHNYQNTVIAPTCTEGGYTLHKCACGESFKDTYTDALGHTPELKNAKDASCTNDGYTGDEICKTCGKTVKSGEVIKAKGHSYSNGKCTVCGAADPNYVPPTVKPTPPPADNPFSDVAESDWFHAPVLWAVQNGVTGGTSPTTFSPDAFCTRAQVVTFLWAANGKPEPTSMNNPFTDVSDSAWYCKAVMWAVEKGITGGTSPTTFSPDAFCTRAQVATFLYAAEGKPAVKNPNNEFIDVPDGAWYLNPVLWAKENDITGGIGGGKFGPDQTCTRAQIATFLYKAMS